MKVLKILLITIAILIVLLVGVYAYISIFMPNVDPPKDMTIKATPERIDRGKYLANHVSVCIDCHSQRDWNLFSGPIIPGTEGMGGDVFPEEAGFPGTFYARNITPAGISDYTDGELYRVITTGVRKNGEPMFPLMPYQSYSKMDPEDIYSIIAYIRTLQAIPNEVPDSKVNFPLNLIIRMAAKDVHTPGKRPPESDQVAYGKYLTQIAACADCHTPQVKGEKIPGKYLAGGFKFPLPNGVTIYSKNITPDKETGIGNWTEEDFLDRFKYYQVELELGDGDSSKTITEIRREKVGKGDFNTVMPWTMFAGMKESDLKAIFAYLRTVQPVNNEVPDFE